MPVPPQSLDLRVAITNLGPIVDADIDLRPMTVFVGPSNTGKSYLAMALYSLHQSISNNMAYLAEKMQYWQTSHMHALYNDAEFLTQLMNWTDSVSLGAISSNTYSTTPILVPDAIANSFRPVLRERTLLGHIVLEEIKRCFGIDEVGTLKRHRSRATATVALKRQPGPEAESFEHEFTLSNGLVSPTVSIPESLPLYLYPTGPEWYRRLNRLSQMAGLFPRSHDVWDSFAIHDIFISLLDANAFGPLHLQAYYLPAGRAGIMHVHGLAVSAVIERASRVGLQRERPSPFLSGVLSDFLRTLIAIANAPAESDPELAREIEEDLLGGSLHVERPTTDYPLFTYLPQGWRAGTAMPLMRASSMVSELAPVFLYLRRLLNVGDVLIIEEPESHLHPAMQVEFIRLLARVVKTGVRVIITTHSEWVLEELANLIRLSDVSERDRQSLDEAECALQPDDVGVWLFEHGRRPKGSIVKEIPLDVEFGGFRSEFERVAISTHNKWAEISDLATRGLEG